MKLIIIGAGGHGKVVSEIAQDLKKYDDIVFLDDNKVGKNINGLKVIGKISDVEDFKGIYKNAFVAIGDNKIRLELLNNLKDLGFYIPSIIHPRAIVSKYSNIDDGVVVMGGSVINSNVKLGFGSIINTGVNIDHDCEIGRSVHISPGSNLGGTVKVDDLTWIGIGSNIINNVHIGKNVVVGAGTVVIKNIDDDCKVVGNPARNIKE